MLFPATRQRKLWDAKLGSPEIEERGWGKESRYPPPSFSEFPLYFTSNGTLYVHFKRKAKEGQDHHFAKCRRILLSSLSDKKSGLIQQPHYRALRGKKKKWLLNNRTTKIQMGFRNERCIAISSDEIWMSGESLGETNKYVA